MKRELAVFLSFISLSIALTSTSQAHLKQGKEQSKNNVSIADIMIGQFTPRHEGVPRGTAGGSSRGPSSCPTDSVNHGARLVPILAAPEQNLTMSSRPSFLVHINNKAVNQLFLSVVDDQGNYDYQAYIPIPEESGILNITLPEEAPSLTVGATYEWSLAIVCADSLRPSDPAISGTVQRIDTDPVAIANSMEQVEWYISHNAWYDTIGTLASLRQANPNDRNLGSIWDTALETVGLPELTDEPLLF